jgi:hypothetical protein
MSDIINGLDRLNAESVVGKTPSQVMQLDYIAWSDQARRSLVANDRPTASLIRLGREVHCSRNELAFKP